jgi:hypothetical protein
MLPSLKSRTELAVGPAANPAAALTPIMAAARMMAYRGFIPLLQGLDEFDAAASLEESSLKRWASCWAHLGKTLEVHQRRTSRARITT